MSLNAPPDRFDAELDEGSCNVASVNELESQQAPHFSAPFFISAASGGTADAGPDHEMRHHVRRGSCSGSIGSLSFPSVMLTQSNSTTTEVFDPTFKHLFSVPTSKIAHLPPAKLNITRLVVCKNYSHLGGASSCAVGELCKFVHIDAEMSELPMHSVHVRYAWRHESLCIYPRHQSGPLLEVWPAPAAGAVSEDTANSHGSSGTGGIKIRSELILVTAGSQKAFAQLEASQQNVDGNDAGKTPSINHHGHVHHCPQYFSMRMCKLGDQCGDIHAVTVDPTVTGDFKWVSVSKLSKISSNTSPGMSQQGGFSPMGSINIPSAAAVSASAHPHQLQPQPQPQTSTVFPAAPMMQILQPQQLAPQQYVQQVPYYQHQPVMQMMPPQPMLHPQMVFAHQQGLAPLPGGFLHPAPHQGVPQMMLYPSMQPHGTTPGVSFIPQQVVQQQQLPQQLPQQQFMYVTSATGQPMMMQQTPPMQLNQFNPSQMVMMVQQPPQQQQQQGGFTLAHAQQQQQQQQQQQPWAR